MHTPAASVIMPVFNGEPYAGPAVESILQQTFADLELIVVDDGSTDRTPRTLASFSDPRLRVIRQPNQGGSAAMNAGLRAARAELVTFMDADDLSDPRRIERQVAYLTSHPEVDGVGTWGLVIDAKGRVLDRAEGPLAHKDIVQCHAEGRMGLNGITPMVRAVVFRELGGFREQLRMAKDMDMWMRASERFRFACLPEYLYYYRLHPGSSNTARKQASVFYRNLVNQMRLERLATGTDKLARGEPVVIPAFAEGRATSSYARSAAWYYRRLSQHNLEQGQWGVALRWAVASWWQQPVSQPASRHLVKTLLWPVIGSGR
jgi:glycosyltransferase involved in cell wall biosynthesis